MKYVFAMLTLISICLPLWTTVYAGDEIGEEYIVKILDGELKKSLTVAPVGFAFNVEFSRSSERTGAITKQTPQQGREKEEDFYKKLIPVGRALESEALRRWRFAIAVFPPERVRSNDDGNASLAVAEEIKQFLTTYFMIAADRIVVRSEDTRSVTASVGLESASTLRWRVEITRFE